MSSIEFVALGGVNEGYSANGTIKYSKDGQIWKNAESGGFGISNWGYSVNYSPTQDLWVATGGGAAGGDTIKYSEDGKNWKNSESGSFTISADQGTSIIGNGAGVAYSAKQGLWVAVGEDAYGETIKYSEDGKNWKNIESGNFSMDEDYGGGNNVFYSPIQNLWVASGFSDIPEGSLKYSEDGKIWKNSESGSFGISYFATGIAYSSRQNLWVAMASSNNSKETIKYSEDGKNWKNSESGSFGISGAGMGVAYSESKDLWVAVGSVYFDALVEEQFKANVAGSIKISKDGKSWATVGNGFQGGARDVAYSPLENIWIAVGWDPEDSTIKYSKDGYLWKNVEKGGLESGNAYGVASRSSSLLPYLY